MHNSLSSSPIIQDIRKGDVLLLLCFLILAAGIALFPLLGSASARGTDSSAQQTVTIRVAGDLYGDYPLSKDQEIPIQTSYGSNTVVIKGSTVCVTSSDCSNQICVQHSPISSTGEMIVCLPHRLSVTITSNKISKISGVHSGGGSGTPGTSNGSSNGTSNGTTDTPAYDAIVR